MSGKMRQIRWMGIFFCMMALGFIMTPVSSCAVEKDAASISALEKKMLSPSTKKIQYRRGKIRSVAPSKWKKAQKISRTADSVAIKRKGWYTICVTTKSGKKKLTELYFYKKNYEITMNKRVRLPEGDYYIVPGGNKEYAVEVQNASLRSGGNVSIWKRGDCACRVWKLESAGGSKIRLKNVNSGLYLTCREKKGTYQAVQKKKSGKNENQIFSLYDAGAGYTYIKCKGTKQFLHVDGNDLEFSSRKRQKAWKYKWEQTGTPVSSAMVTGATYPTSLNAGSSFTLKGTVISRYTMTMLDAAVYDRTGKAVLQKKIYPYSCSATLKEIDSSITFGKLPSGAYTYKVVVRDVAGKDIPVINRTFTVGMISVFGGKTLSYDSGLIEKIGHQSNGTALEKKACASYALAYCNAILTGATPSPHTYWSSDTNVDCVWTKGGYMTLSYSSEQAVLQAAYTQLAAGKPSILHVTGSTAQHWITIIGCKKTTLTVGLSVSDFIAIDPWDGKVITVSDKYKVKTTYRLGVKS